MVKPDLRITEKVVGKGGRLGSKRHGFSEERGRVGAEALEKQLRLAEVWFLL